MVLTCWDQKEVFQISMQHKDAFMFIEETHSKRIEILHLTPNCNIKSTGQCIFHSQKQICAVNYQTPTRQMN